MGSDMEKRQISTAFHRKWLENQRGLLQEGDTRENLERRRLNI